MKSHDGDSGSAPSTGPETAFDTEFHMTLRFTAKDEKNAAGAAISSRYPSGLSAQPCP
jgi:hypothetical protein